MAQRRIPAVFMRGGTSKGLFFHDRDLPPSRAERDAIFLAALGSPDAYGRQLDGLGGGISSLSKVVVIAPSTRPGVDVDYTFGQVDIASPHVDYGATCGNLSSAVGPFAVDERLVQAVGAETVVRVFNTNTEKAFEVVVPLEDGRAACTGDFAIPGVHGTGARIRLDFLDPGGASTGRLLPTGSAVETLDPGDGSAVDASIVDATTVCVFVPAPMVGLSATELPGDLDGMADALAILERIRAAAAVRLGLAATAADASARSKASPKVAIVAPPADAPCLDGSTTRAEDMDIAIRMISMGQPHRAVPLTGGLCLAVAMRIEGTVVNGLMRRAAGDGRFLRVGTPSGVVPLGAVVQHLDGTWQADRAIAYRTARRLMEGQVLVPERMAAQAAMASG